MLAHAQPRLRVVDGGRKADKRTAVSDLLMEVRAAGQEMRATAYRISNSLIAGDVTTAQHFAARLWVLGDGYANYTEGGSSEPAA